MATKPRKAADRAAAENPVEKEFKIRPTPVGQFRLWIVGTTPLICHAWSEKSRRTMLGAQQQAITGGPGVRDPQADFESSLYEMADGVYGFPVTGLKKAILAPAHKNRGVARSSVSSSLWLNHELIRVRPALRGAICDLPLVKVIAGEPEMREDPVRVGVGLNKKATLAYRGQFWPWAMRIGGRYNTDALKMDSIMTLIHEGGMSVGIGEWRPERGGIFGCFRLATDAETRAWESYRVGKGKLPPAPVELDDAAD